MSNLEYSISNIQMRTQTWNFEFETWNFFEHLCRADRSIAALLSGGGVESPGNAGHHAS
jgi:hypothetical protein